MFIAGGGGAGGSVNRGGDEGGGGGGGGSFGFGTIEFNNDLLYNFEVGEGGKNIKNHPQPGGNSCLYSNDKSLIEFYPGGGAGGSGQGGGTSPGVAERFGGMIQSLNEGFQGFAEGYHGKYSEKTLIDYKLPFHGGGGGNGWGTMWSGSPGTNIEFLSSRFPEVNKYPNINRQYTKAGGDGKHEEGGGGGGGAIGPGQSSSNANNGMYGAGFLIPELKNIIENLNIDMNKIKEQLKSGGYPFPIPDNVTDLFTFCRGGYGGKGRTNPSNRQSLKMVGDGGNGGDSHGGQGQDGIFGTIILIFNENELMNERQVTQKRNPNPNPTNQEINDHRVRKTKVEKVHSMPASDQYFNGGIKEIIAYTSPNNFTTKMRFQIEEYFLKTYKLYTQPSFRQMMMNNAGLLSEISNLNIGSPSTGILGPDINNNMQISYNGVATGSEFYIHDTGDSIIAKYNPEPLKQNCQATSDWLKTIPISWDAITSSNGCDQLRNLHK